MLTDAPSSQVDISDQVRSSMLEMLLTELELSVSFENHSNITRDTFTNSSLDCSSEGSDYTLAMSADITFSNSDGSVTASALVARATEWMDGVRTVNGLSFQLSRPVSQRDTSEMVIIMSMNKHNKLWLMAYYIMSLINTILIAPGDIFITLYCSSE